MHTENIVTQTNLERYLYQPVVKIPLSKLLPNHKPPKGQSHLILEEESGNILSFCSEDYHLRLNKPLFTKFEAKLKEKNISFNKKITIIDGTKFYVDYIIMQRIQSSIIKDLLPVFSIWNSYDGKIKTQIVFGYHKLLCGNFLNRPNEGICHLQVSAKHSSLEDKEFFKDTIDEFIDQAISFLNHTKEDIKEFELMCHKKSSKSVLQKVVSKLSINEKAKQIAILQLEKEIQPGSYLNENGEQVSYPGTDVSNFSIYNAINYAIFHTNSKELPDTKIKKDKMLICCFLSKNMQKIKNSIAIE